VARCRFPIATSDRYTDRDGQRQERTDWHNIVLWNKLAEIAGEYLKKGRQVFIEGSIRTRQYQDKSGETRYITEIVGRQMQMLGGPGGQRGVEETPPPEEPESTGISSRKEPSPRPAAEPEAAQETPPGDEDDLPF
jgi:single-strand DNA-binding protein